MVLEQDQRRAQEVNYEENEDIGVLICPSQTPPAVQLPPDVLLKLSEEFLQPQFALVKLNLDDNFSIFASIQEK